MRASCSLSAGLLGRVVAELPRNKALIAQTDSGDRRLPHARRARSAQETVIADRDFAKVLPLLHMLRYMPAGYGNRDAPTPFLAELRAEPARAPAIVVGERLPRRRSSACSARA